MSSQCNTNCSVFETFNHSEFQYTRCMNMDNTEVDLIHSAYALCIMLMLFSLIIFMLGLHWMHLVVRDSLSCAWKMHWTDQEINNHKNAKRAL